MARVELLHILGHYVHGLGLWQLQIPGHVAAQVVPVRAQQLEVYGAHAECALPVNGILTPAAEGGAGSLLAVLGGLVIPFLLLLTFPR